MKKSTRRDFIKAALVAVPAITLSKITGIKEVFAEDLKIIDEKSAMGMTLGLVHDASKTDTVKFPKRKGPEGEKQFCYNCVLLTQGGLKVPGQEGEWGKCAIFPGGVVGMNGWCNSWVPKA